MECDGKKDDQDSRCGMFTGVFEANCDADSITWYRGSIQSCSGKQTLEWEIDSHTERGVWSSIGCPGKSVMSVT